MTLKSRAKSILIAAAMCASSLATAGDYPEVTVTNPDPRSDLYPHPGRQ